MTTGQENINYQPVVVELRTGLGKAGTSCCPAPITTTKHLRSEGLFTRKREEKIYHGSAPDTGRKSVVWRRASALVVDRNSINASATRKSFRCGARR